jgi:hypothetical protein
MSVSSLTERLFAWTPWGRLRTSAASPAGPATAVRPSTAIVVQASAAPLKSSRKRAWSIAGMTAFLSGLGGFITISSCVHLLAVGVIATVPIHFTPNLDAQKKRRSEVNTEVKAADAPAFEFARVTEVRVPKDWDFAAQVVAPQETEKTISEPPPAPKPAARRAADETGAEVTAAEAAAALASALTWFVRHQEADGSWTLDGFERQCRNKACGGAGSWRSPAAATGLALTPLIGAVDNRAAAAAFDDTIRRGVGWLLYHQRPDGDLSAFGEQRMFSHAMAGLALCRRYAALREPQVGAAVQWAVQFSIAAQNPQSGGWGYEPGGRGNTSSVAWQLMFLQAAHGAGLKVEPLCWRRADLWMRSVAQGDGHGQFSDEPNGPVTGSMTAVGLEYLRFRGLKPNHATLIDGHAYILQNPPDGVFERDVFYWYLGAPAARNFGSGDWSPWRRRMRRALLNTQAIEGCEAGSWVADASAEAWSVQGGRLLVTSLAAQLLEAESKTASPIAPAEQGPIAAAPGVLQR